MFKKKIKCKCGKKIDKSYSYCPYCGYILKDITKQRDQRKKQEREEDYEDRDFKNFEQAFNEAFKMPFLFKFPFKRFVKQIDKQFKDMDKALAEKKKEKQEKEKLVIRPGFFPFPMPAASGISISIATSSGGQPVIKVKKFGQGQPEETVKKGGERELEEKEKIKEKLRFTKAQSEKFAKLPRKEPKTSVRRLTDKIIYEIILPGVKNEKDIIINKLQNSIEIKAFTKDKAYFKLIPIDMPIKDYYLEKDKLILELKP